MSGTDLSYYKSYDDYENFAPYLDEEPVVVDDSSLPPFKPDFSSAIIVDDIPKVTQDKVTRLKEALVKIYAQVAPVSEADIYMPFDDAENISYGFCFIKFPSKELAEIAVKATQGYKLGKNIFKVNSYADFDALEPLTENDEPPKLLDFNARPDISTWLKDAQCRDQFSVRYGRETEIYWMNTTSGEPASKVYGGEREKDSKGRVWCESTIEWSPQGTFFATFHNPGIKLWGGDDFKAFGRFMHTKVEELSFSPCEKYMITYRLTEHPNCDPNEAIIVWDVRTGVKLKSFGLKSPFDKGMHVQASITVEDKNFKKIDKVIRGKVKDYNDDEKEFSIEDGNVVYEKIPLRAVTALQDPNKLKWSADGNYFARVGPDMTSVYTTPTVNLLDRKSVLTKDVLDFVWSPRTNLFSYWSPAVGNYPARVNILRIPDRQEICSKNFFDVTDGKMIWQNEGDYLCTHMVKSQGKKKSYVLAFFRVKDSGVPVELLELSEPIIQIAWEPSGDRCAIAYGDTRNPTVSFYSMINQNVVTKAIPGATKTAAPTVRNELTHLFTKNNVKCHDIQWSPSGGFVALAYFATDGCGFELIDVDTGNTMASRHHERGNKLCWDPSGRFITTATITELRNAYSVGHSEDGVNFYHFQGNLFYQFKREKLYSFAWRPRPKDLLTADEKKKVIKNLGKYSKKFEKEDRARKEELNAELQAHRFKVASEFLQWRNKNRAISAQLKPLRVALRDGYDSDDDRNYEIITMVSPRLPPIQCNAMQCSAVHL